MTNYSDLSNTSLSIFIEGDFDEERDKSEIHKRVWSFDNDKIVLPAKFKKELKRRVYDILE